MTEEMIRRYSVLVDFLGQALGPDYEVTLYDLEPENSTIVAIANGRISGRTVGSPLTSTGQKLLSQKQYQDRDYNLNYTSLLSSGKVVRSSTLFIKDNDGVPAGLLCINFDDSRFHALSDSILKLIHPDDFVHHHYFPVPAQTQPAVRPGRPGDPPSENIYNDVGGMVKEIFDEVAGTISVPLDRLTQDERTQFIAQLNERGMFRLKGAVQYATERLACSQASVYRYLSKAKKE